MLHLEHRPAPPPTTTTTPKPVKDIEDKTDAMSEMNTLDMSSKGGSNKTKQTKKNSYKLNRAEMRQNGISLQMEIQKKAFVLVLISRM